MKAEVKTITPQEAAEILEKYKYHGQRKISPAHVEELKREMLAGRFVGATVEIVRNGKSAYLTNGQHTLSAVVASGIEQQLIFVERHSLSIEQDAARVYTSTDIGKKRSLIDKLSAYGLPSELGVNVSLTAHISAAVLLILTGFEVSGRKMGSVTLDELIVGMRLYKGPSLAYINAAGSQSNMGKKMLNRAPMAIGIATFSCCEKKAGEFWGVVSSGLSEKKNDPRLMLREKLATFSVSGGGSTYKALSVPQFLRMAASAWNAYYNGENFRNFKYSGPLYIAGVTEPD